VSITEANGLMFLTFAFVFSSLVSHTCHMTCTSRPSWFEHRIDISGEEPRPWSSSLRSYFPESCWLHVLQHLSLNTFSIKACR